MKSKQLKTTLATITEKCFVDKKTLLKLNGSESLSEDYKKHHGFDPCLSCNCNNFDCVFSDDDKFYYKLEHFCNSQLMMTEIGLGELSGTKKQRYINRLKPIVRLSDEKGLIHSPVVYSPQLDKNSFLQVSTMTSGNLSEILIDPHVIPYTDIESCKSPLYVQADSLIGRLKGSIQNITIVDIIDLLSSFTKSIHLKAYKLYISILNCKHIIFSQVKKPKRPIKGTLTWSDDGKLRLYNGKEWLIIQTELDINEKT